MDWGLVAVGLAVAVAAFLVGSVNPAATIARVLGRDLRGSGSGNPGATNAGRVLGVRWGVLVGVLDVGKGFVPTLVALRGLGTALAAVVGLAVVLGHIWSPFLRGHGGKGVATSLGALLALTPWLALVAVVVFLGAVLWLRTTGKASILTCAALVVAGLLSALRVVTPAEVGVSLWAVLLGAIVLARHHRNLRAWARLVRR